MKSYLVTILSFLLCKVIIAQSITEKTRIISEALVDQNYSIAVEHFNEDVRSKLNAEALEQTMRKITEQNGKLAFVNNIRIKEEKRESRVKLNFEKTALDLKLSFDKANYVNGIFFVSPESMKSYQPPSYAEQSKIKIIDFSFGLDEFPLAGKVYKPLESSSEQCIIMVHGSGPNDMDGTLGPNKIFRDLAYGFAKNGISSILYNKRSFSHGQKMYESIDNLTLKEETVDDAVLLSNKAKSQTDWECSEVTILGHSLGAYASPLIAKNSNNVDKVIMMAAPARNLADIIYEQSRYIFNMDSIDAREEVQLKALKEQVELSKSDTLSAKTPNYKLPLSMPANYWIYLRKYNHFKLFRNLDIPVYIIQGKRDYQVTLEDFNRWERASIDRKNVDLKIYDQLNHLFMPGTGKSRPEEYEKSNHVPLNVINELAEWIKNH